MAGIAPSARATALGVSSQYKDARAGSTRYLPQRVGLFAQGRTGVVYSSTKRQVYSASEAGDTYGYGSPIHLCAKQLLPANGDGLGVIPLTVYPLSDAVGSTAAVGGVASPTGTQASASSHYYRAGGVLSQQFTIPKNASPNDFFRVSLVAMNAALEFPLLPSLTYSAPSSTPGTNTGNGTITGLAVSGGGTPIPGTWTFRCITAVTNGGVFQLIDPSGALVATVTLTPGVGQTTLVTQGGLTFTVTDGTTDFAVNDSFTFSVTATAMAVTSKWKGASANAIGLELLGTTGGFSVAITQPTGGLVNPTVDTALGQVGNAWETMILNALNYDDTVALDAFQAWGVGRHDPLVSKPAIVFTGYTGASTTNATLITGTRKTDFVNSYLTSPGTVDLPFIVAARQLARIAKVANENPPTSYVGQRATGLTPGADAVQWQYNQRDSGAVQQGVSTIEVIDSVVNIADVVTMYRPAGEDPPAFQYVVNIVKLQNVLYNLSQNFAGAEWRSAPLIPDNQSSKNPNAKRPKDYKTRMMASADGLGQEAIIADPAYTKANCSALLDSQNSNRINLAFPVKLSGNGTIVDVIAYFSFYFAA